MLGGAGGCVAVLIFTLTYHLGHTWCMHVRVVYYDYATEEQPYCNSNTSCPRLLHRSQAPLSPRPAHFACISTTVFYRGTIPGFFNFSR
eukprot:COSAG01_NODE_9519_length_2421_cov_30.252369_3_plen_89_part_00